MQCTVIYYHIILLKVMHVLNNKDENTLMIIAKAIVNTSIVQVIIITYNTVNNKIKLIIRGVWCSRLCSVMFRCVTICSLQHRHFRKSVCSSLGLLSTCSRSRFSMIEQNTFPRIHHVRGTTKVGEGTKIVQKRRLKWYGHATKRELHCRRAMEIKAQERRKIGLPKRRRLDKVKDGIKEKGL